MYEPTTTSADQLNKPEDAGKGIEGEIKRWMMEINLAGKTEKNWRDKAIKAQDRYRDETDRADFKFNIYWANVETMRPVLYSTPPRLDVRRRFRDADPVGKIAAEVMERALDYSLDSYDFDEEIDNIIMDYLIPSRGVGRVRFEPTLEDKESEADAEGKKEAYQELTYARCYIEHVAWDRFRRGPGITWKEVPWIAYEHQLTQGEIEKQFPGFGSKVQYDIIMEGVDKDKANSEPSVFKRVQVWELWDKSAKKIRFIAPSYSEGYLKVEDDKLNLEGFFDCERPLYGVKTSNTLVPQVEFEMYRDQAKELDRVTKRIASIVNTLRQRGIYDSTVTEFKDLLKAGDNEMIPTATSGPAMQMGGLDKAIWMMPIEQAANVLKELLAYREQVKQTIYEITGMADIIRGATDPDETLGAQQLKVQTGSRRIQRRQRDVQRFIKGMIRKKAQIIAENYTPQLLALMTGIQLLTAEEKAMVQQSQAALGQQMPQGGQVPQPQIPPEVQQLLSLPSWDDVMQVIKNDLLRSFRIDIETDSTIAADQEADREQVTEMIKGIGGFVESVGPAIEQGAISMDTAKKILLSAVRRFKFGREVEDAIDQDTGQQQQKPDPEMAKVQAQAELEKQKLANAKELEQFRAQNDAQVAQATQQAQAQQNIEQNKAESARKDQEMKLAHEANLKQIMLKHQLELEKIRAQSGAKLQEIAAEAQADAQERESDQKHDLLKTGVTFVADIAKAEHAASLQPEPKETA